MRYRIYETLHLGKAMARQAGRKAEALDETITKQAIVKSLISVFIRALPW